MSAARAEILRRIKGALQSVPDDEHPNDVLIERTYRQAGESTRDVLVAHFAERVSEYKAVVRLVVPDDLQDAITAACRVRGVQRLVVPVDLPANWTPDEVEVVPDQDLTYAQLDQSDGVLTGCALGIAQTGTIVLDGGPVQGRRVTTLLPDYHLCVVFADQIVELVPQAIAQLSDAVHERRQPVTFISGPSATSDIELNRVEGVHGPRTLEVLIVVADK